MKDKFILDVCCGNRMFWFNKNHPNALYLDIRKEGKGSRKHRPNFDVQPDQVMDFRDLKFPNKSFRLVVWDPPHLTSLGLNSDMRKAYGVLDKKTFPMDLRKGFQECWRVLKEHGVLIFKWNETQIPVSKILALTPYKPVVGHKSGRRSNTHWICFMKAT